jgi:hypothetical protein
MMPRPRHFHFALAVLMSAAACGGGDATGTQTPPPNTHALAPGEIATAPNGQVVTLTGAAGGEYLLVVTDTAPDASGTSNYQVSAAGIAAAGSVSAPATALLPTTAAGALPERSRLDISYGARLNERYRRRFTSLLQSARLSNTTGARYDRNLDAAASPVPPVGSLVTYNVSASPCDSIVNHAARIMAIGTQAIVAMDTLNPPGGFTATDYQRFAANFDTLVYPLDVANFGTPGDIDQNGHIIILFTRAVNELTPRNSDSFVGGFFFARDLFPHASTPQLQACAGSNVAEMFYMLAPDPTGIVNGNVRSTGFVDSLTTSVLAHEFQHLINASRRIFVNNASDLEDVWLNEGLSHIAEELLFYRQSGLGPRQNLTITNLRSSETVRGAFNLDQAANAGRYREYLLAPSKNSPVRDDDSLATRGATWDFLRYAADRKTGSGGQDAGVFQALVNSTTVGTANLRNVFGPDLGGWIQDWSVSHYTDDVTPGVPAEVTQPSWNWHNIYPALNGGGGNYPLATNSLTTSGASGTVIPGASAFYRFAISPGGTGTVTVSGGKAASGLPIGSIVRLR